MSTGKKREKKKKIRTKVKRSKTLNFNKKNFKKYATKRRVSEKLDKEIQKQMKEERKKIEKERRKLESDKKQLKNAKNKLQNEQQKLSKFTKRKSIKDLNQTKRFQLEIDEYKQEIHSLKKFKKQIYSMKKKQSKKKLHKNEKVKYIWTENIKQIKVLNKNKAISILFEGDDNERIFTDINVVLPSKLMENDKIINYLLNELNDRISDIKSLQSMIHFSKQKEIENFVTNKILQRHCANKPSFVENDVNFLSKLRQNNKLWRYALLRKEELNGSIFDIWMNAQNQIKGCKNPDICMENGVVLQNIYDKEKKREFNIHSARAMTARRYQKLINQKTDAMYFLNDHHGQYEYDEDEDLLDSTDHSLKSNLFSNSLNLTPTYSNTSNSHSQSHSHSHSTDDDNYHQYIDSVYQFINQQQRDSLINIGIFLNKIVPNKYKPICSYSNSEPYVKGIIYKLFDGKIFAEIINILQPDCIDLRCMEYNTEEKVSNYKENIIGNMNVIINSLYALNVSYGYNDALSINPENIKDLYFNVSYTLSIMNNICEYLIANYFNAKLNIYKCGELIRLCQNEEEQRSCNNWSYTIWLKRWLLFIKHPKLKHNRSKKRRKSQLKHSIDLKDHLDCNDMDNLSRSRARSTSGNRLELINPVIEDEKMSLNDNFTSENTESSNKENNDYLNDIELVYKALNVEIEFKENESEYKNSYYLQQMILINIFKIQNNINKLSEKEKQSIKFVALDGESKYMVSWINWMNSLNHFKWENINDLHEDISDGLVILHLLNQCKDGCVDWKKVKIKIRNKFDKMANAKEILLACKQFKFKLIGINENNIVDVNKKYIKSLLKQIKMHFIKEKMMTYLNIISENINDAVFDEIILKWTNKQFRQFQQNNKANNVILHNDGKEVVSLKDKSLSDCIYFFNLLSCINTCDKYINYSLIYKGKETELKIKNANYLLTILRKLGCNLFASAYDIYHCKYDVILSVVSCIIHIAQKNE